jgi:chorismate synthase
VAAGAICKYALEQKGIYIGTHIKRCAGISDRDFENIKEDIDLLSKMTFAVLDNGVADKMRTAILDAASEGDSVGGVLETAIVGMPAGVGEPWFDTLEGMISHIMFSIPAIKGIEFGAGFSIADMHGSNANDQMQIENGKVVSLTNNNGGINGGISNGMPIIFRTAVKPTPTIFKQQNTVDFKKMENALLEAKGRHDPAIVHRARIVQDAAAAIVLCDALSMRYGTDWLGE